MRARTGNRATLTKQLKKVFYHYATVFHKFVKLMRKQCQHNEEHITVEISKTVFIELLQKRLKIH